MGGGGGGGCLVIGLRKNAGRDRGNEISRGFFFLNTSEF